MRSAGSGVAAARGADGAGSGEGAVNVLAVGGVAAAAADATEVAGSVWFATVGGAKRLFMKVPIPAMA